jgi:hypothetical protein
MCVLLRWCSGCAQRSRTIFVNNLTARRYWIATQRPLFQQGVAILLHNVSYLSLPFADQKSIAGTAGYEQSAIGLLLEGVLIHQREAEGALAQEFEALVAVERMIEARAHVAIEALQR